MNAARKKLESALDKSLAPVKEQAAGAYHEVVDLLRGFADKVAAAVNSGGGAVADVKLELGHLVNQGQEHRVVIRAPEIGLSDYLLRAFVPPDGYPVVLDLLSEGDRVCDDADGLVAALVELSELAATQQRLAVIRSALADESLRGERKVVGVVRKPAVKSTKGTAKRGAHTATSKGGKG
ncbi:MAG: hypothetical protein QM820_52210 [Minicystis sp.]